MSNSRRDNWPEEMRNKKWGEMTTAERMIACSPMWVVCRINEGRVEGLVENSFSMDWTTDRAMVFWNSIDGTIEAESWARHNEMRDEGGRAFMLGSPECPIEISEDSMGKSFNSTYKYTQRNALFTQKKFASRSEQVDLLAWRLESMANARAAIVRKAKAQYQKAINELSKDFEKEVGAQHYIDDGVIATHRKLGLDVLQMSGRAFFKDDGKVDRNVPAVLHAMNAGLVFGYDIPRSRKELVTWAEMLTHKFDMEESK